MKSTNKPFNPTSDKVSKRAFLHTSPVEVALTVPEITGYIIVKIFMILMVMRGELTHTWDGDQKMHLGKHEGGIGDQSQTSSCCPSEARHATRADHCWCVLDKNTSLKGSTVRKHQDTRKYATESQPDD